MFDTMFGSAMRRISRFILVRVLNLLRVTNAKIGILLFFSVVSVTDNVFYAEMEHKLLI